MTESENRNKGRGAMGCNVSSTLNFTIGVLAIVAAVVIAWLLWRWLR
jgi:hypothetical protein